MAENELRAAKGATVAAQPREAEGWRVGVARWAVLTVVAGLVASVAAQEFTVRQHYNALANLAAERVASPLNDTSYADLAVHVTEWALPPYVASLQALLVLLPVLWIVETRGVRVVLSGLGGFACAGVLVKTAATFLDLPNAAIHAGQAVINVSRVALLPVAHRLCVAWCPRSCVSLACALLFFCDHLGVLWGFLTPHLMFCLYDAHLTQFTVHIVYPFLVMSALPLVFSVPVFFVRGEPKEAPSVAEAVRRGLAKRQESLAGFSRRVHALFASDSSLAMDALSFGLAHGVVTSMLHPLRLTVLFKVHDEQTDERLQLALSAALAAGGCVGALASGLLLDRTRRHQLLGQCAYSGLFASHVLLVVSVYSHSRFFILFSYATLSLFFSAYVVSAVEYAAERSFPWLESSTSGVLLAAGYLVSGVLAACFGTHFENRNDATLTGYVASALLLVGLIFSAGLDPAFLNRQHAHRLYSDSN